MRRLRARVASMEDCLGSELQAIRQACHKWLYEGGPDEHERSLGDALEQLTQLQRDVRRLELERPMAEDAIGQRVREVDRAEQQRVVEKLGLDRRLLEEYVAQLDDKWCRLHEGTKDRVSLLELSAAKGVASEPHVLLQGDWLKGLSADVSQLGQKLAALDDGCRRLGHQQISFEEKIQANTAVALEGLEQCLERATEAIRSEAHHDNLAVKTKLETDMNDLRMATSSSLLKAIDEVSTSLEKYTGETIARVKEECSASDQRIDSRCHQLEERIQVLELRIDTIRVLVLKLSLLLLVVVVVSLL